MNKQQLIDKAIDELDGIWREDSRDVPLTMLLHSSGNKVALSGSINEWVTRQEFEARKAEREQDKREAEKMLGMINSCATRPQQHWYDYENQKALRFPPVGEVVQMVTNLDEVRIVAHDKEFAVYWYEWFSEYQHTDAYELFRPLDWDKKKNDELQELTLLINSGFITTDPEGIAKAILAAGYRKCDNKTQSTQE